MSGRHRVQRPRPVRTVLVLSVRWAWRTARACLVAPAAGVIWLADKVVAWAESRFDERDPFADVELAPRDTTPDPVPVLAAPVEEPDEPAIQGPLTPAEAHWALHQQHPDLPRDRVRWHFFDGAIGGEVDVLSVGEVGQRATVARYAEAFGAKVTERPDDTHVVVGTVGEFANVTITVTAVILHDDTIPLRVFEEAAADPTIGDATQTTQALSDEVLAEVVGAR